MRILHIGDIFGKPGRRAVRETLPLLIREASIDFVIANAENMAGGKGMTEKTVHELFENGVDVITGGNHSFEKEEIFPLMENDLRIVRPLNLIEKMPGRGSIVRETRTGKKVGVVNAMGKVHIERVENPFEPTKMAVVKLSAETKVVMVDFHAEATSEMRMMGWFLDGLASAVLGTHTHVQTADEEVLPKGTAYISDIGMTGPYDSVIGLRTDLAEGRFLRGDRKHFDVGRNDIRFCAVIVDVDEATGKARSIERIRRDVSGG